MNYKRKYDAQIKRGTITENTTIYDFLKKLREEYFELNKELQTDAFETGGLRHVTIQEAMDVISVLENMLYHEGVDIDKEREINTIHQETRED